MREWHERQALGLWTLSFAMLKCKSIFVTIKSLNRLDWFEKCQFTSRILIGKLICMLLEKVSEYISFFGRCQEHDVYQTHLYVSIISWEITPNKSDNFQKPQGYHRLISTWVAAQIRHGGKIIYSWFVASAADLNWSLTVEHQWLLQLHIITPRDFFAWCFKY